jgi:virginiamycin A acetyltransferase
MSSDRTLPDPLSPLPTPGQPRVRFLRAIVTSPLIEVGAYSYYDDPDDPSAFETRNVLYHYGPDRLRIGAYCALATGVRFIMGGANHRASGPSTFPFPIFGGAWADATDLLVDLPNRGDTIVGNDVWLGFGALVMPGVRIGDGAIVAAGSVVTRDVRPYAIVGGNPATEIKRRFEHATEERLLAAAWWNWPAERVSRNVRLLMEGDVEAIERAAREITP